MPKPTPERPGIDPTMQAVLDAFEFTVNLDAGVELPREQLRSIKVPSEFLPELRIEERMIDYGDVSDVVVRIYWPPVEQRDNLPVVVFYHGGGFALGDLDVFDPVVRAHCVGAEAIVVAVDYRLAPEHKYPKGLDDAWAALRWVGEHAAEFGGDPTRIAVAGDSAGGNFSAEMAQLARDNGGPALVFQLLWYPSTTFDRTLPSTAENLEGTAFLDEAARTAFMHWYLPPEIDWRYPAKLPTTVAPANATDFSGLPPAYIATADHDTIRDDGAVYARKLSAARVPVQLDNALGLVHAYLNFALVVPAAAEATNRGLAALKAALHPA